MRSNCRYLSTSRNLSRSETTLISGSLRCSAKLRDFPLRGPHPELRRPSDVYFPSKGTTLAPMRTQDVDALLVLSFGGPEGQDEVIPFLRRVVAGRGVPDERLEAVAEQYRYFGGVSPINEVNRDLVERLTENAPVEWQGQQVYLGNRNSEPFLADTMTKMAADGVRTAVVFPTSAFSSYSGCRQYRENLAAALAESGADLDLKIVPKFHDHPTLQEIWTERLAAALPGSEPVRVVFVTHSVPISDSVKYRPQHEALAERIATAAAAEAGMADLDWRMAYQSRSGPPHQPWLEPDIGEEVTAAAEAGVKRLLVVPIGFLSDNLEIRWDLDVTAGKLAEELGVAYQRVEPPQDDPRFIEMIYDLIEEGDGIPCRVGCCPNPRQELPTVGEQADD